MLRNSNPDAFAALKDLRASMSAAEHDAKITLQTEAAWSQHEKKTAKKRKKITSQASSAPSAARQRSGGRRPATSRTTETVKSAKPSRRARYSAQPPSAVSRSVPPTRALIVPRQPIRLMPQTRDASKSLNSAQRATISKISETFRRQRTGLTTEHVADALTRVAAALPKKSVTRGMLREALVRDLGTYMQAATSKMAAEQIMAVTDDIAVAALSPVGSLQATSTQSRNSHQAVKPPSAPTIPRIPARQKPQKKKQQKLEAPAPAIRRRLEDAPVIVTEVRPGRPLKDAASDLRTLQNTDLMREFGTALDTLTRIFQTLRSGNQEMSTGVFLHALHNRFALVVPKSSLRACRTMFRQPSTHLDDVQRLPTTHGIVVQEHGSELMAWNITPEYGEAATVKITDLQQFLSTGRPPRFTYEVLSPRKSTRGLAMRDLATFAEALRHRESGIFPLSADASGRSVSEWTTEHLRRMGEKNPHRVRQHLRTIPSTGEKVLVKEHSRYGVRGVDDTRVRLRLL